MDTKRTLGLMGSLTILCFSAIAQLNDTGQISCANEFTVQLACNDAAAGTQSFAGQDAETGRDFASPDPADGLGGFAFNKLDFAGSSLADQETDYEASPWACVQDLVTGLTWEVKTDDDGLQDKDWTYSWYNSSGINDGGFAGADNIGICVDADNCDTEKYATAINDLAMCGHTDWRLPNALELMSIMAFNPAPFASQTFPLPATVDVDYFPNTLRANYWTAYSSALNPGSAQVIYFGGNNTTEPKSFASSLRLVRGQWGDQP